jgi:hypothetical protein
VKCYVQGRIRDFRSPTKDELRFTAEGGTKPAGQRWRSSTILEVRVLERREDSTQPKFEEPRTIHEHCVLPKSERYEHEESGCYLNPAIEVDLSKSWDENDIVETRAMDSCPRESPVWDGNVLVEDVEFDREDHEDEKEGEYKEADETGLVDAAAAGGDNGVELAAVFLDTVDDEACRGNQLTIMRGMWTENLPQ